MRKWKYLSVVMFCVIVLIILTACNGEVNNDDINTDDIQIIHMGAGDIALASNFDQLVDRYTHIMRVDVLDSHVEWIEDSGTLIMPRPAWIERMIALEWPQEFIDYWIALGDEMDEVYPPWGPAVITIYRAQVLEIFREIDVFYDEQPQVGDIIEIVRFGGLYGHEYWMYGGAELDIGLEYVLFLDRCWQYSHRFHANTIEGAFHVPEVRSEGVDLVEYSDASLELESAGWELRFEVTVQDFIDLVNEDNDDQGEDDDNDGDQGGNGGNGNNNDQGDDDN